MPYPNQDHQLALPEASLAGPRHRLLAARRADGPPDPPGKPPDCFFDELADGIAAAKGAAVSNELDSFVFATHILSDGGKGRFQGKISCARFFPDRTPELSNGQKAPQAVLSITLRPPPCREIIALPVYNNYPIFGHFHL